MTEPKEQSNPVAVAWISHDMVAGHLCIRANLAAEVADLPDGTLLYHMQAVRELISEGVRAGVQAAVNAQFMCGKLPIVAEFDTTTDVNRILAEKGLV